MIRVFVADDHAIVRAGIRQVIEATGDMVIAGEASNGRQVLDAAESADWDVLLLDLSLPRVNGPEVLRRVRERCPGLPVVVLSMYPEVHYAPSLLAAGAFAYVSKEQPITELVDVLRSAALGKPRRHVQRRVVTEATSPHDTLTAREHQVFMLMIQGSAIAEIAAELNLNHSTISTHAAHVRDKLSARTLADVIHYAHRHGLIASPPPAVPATLSEELRGANGPEDAP